MPRTTRHSNISWFAILIVAAIFVSCSNVFAQDEQPLEKPLTIVDGSHLSVSAKMGYSNLMVNSESFKKSRGGLCFGAELDYTHFVSQHIGLRLGVDIMTSMCDYSLDGYTVQSREPVQVWTNPRLGESMTLEATYRTHIDGITTVYTYTAIGIPVQIAFQGEFWYANAGVKFSVPLKLRENSNYGVSESECIDIGNNGVSMPAVNLGKQKIEAIPYNSSARGNLFYPYFVSSLMEGGYRVGNPNGSALTLGVFVEMAFNECHVGNSQSLIVKDGSELSLRPTLNSNAIKSLRLFSVGMKLQYDFSFRHPRKQ